MPPTVSWLEPGTSGNRPCRGQYVSYRECRLPGARAQAGADSTAKRTPLLGMRHVKLRLRDKILSLVWVPLADSELGRNHSPDDLSNKVVGLACLCVQLAQRKVIPQPNVGDGAEVVLTWFNRSKEVARGLQGTKPLPVSADPCATDRSLKHVDQRFAVLRRRRGVLGVVGCHVESDVPGSAGRFSGRYGRLVLAEGAARK